jgi:hypothetical protein
MSVGFSRGRSPAAKSAAYTREGARRFLLKNLSIESVDSVDRGAGHGCESVLMKRYHHGEHYKSESHMSVAESILKSVETPAERLIKAIEAKQIDAMDTWQVIVKLATAAYGARVRARAKQTAMP